MARHSINLTFTFPAIIFFFFQIFNGAADILKSVCVLSMQHGLFHTVSSQGNGSSTQFWCVCVCVCVVWGMFSMPSSCYTPAGYPTIHLSPDTVYL